MIKKPIVDRHTLEYKKTFQESTIEFCSFLEAKTYKILRSFFDEQQIKVNYPINLLPPTRDCPKGKIWKMDFVITYRSSDTPCLLIESKGNLVKRYRKKMLDFRNKIELLKSVNQDYYRRLIIVSYSSLDLRNQVPCILINNFSDYLSNQIIPF